jgi:hypothetical protein
LEVPVVPCPKSSWFPKQTNVAPGSVSPSPKS